MWLRSVGWLAYPPMGPGRAHRGATWCHPFVGKVFHFVVISCAHLSVQLLSLDVGSFLGSIAVRSRSILHPGLSNSCSSATCPFRSYPADRKGGGVVMCS